MPAHNSVCLRCRATFHAKPSKKRRFCTMACYNEDRAEAAAEANPPRTCEECGATFTPQSANQVRLGFGRFCSVACTKAAERQHTRRQFWERTDQSGGPDACWPWQGYCNDQGYGKVNSEGKKWATHRLAFTIAYGPIPDEVDVLHSCDNPPCCNPAHLFLGDDFDNQQDAVAKGRKGGPRPGYMKGEGHIHAKLTEVAVRDIRARVASGELPDDLALEFGVALRTVKDVLARRTWNHVQ